MIFFTFRKLLFFCCVLLVVFLTRQYLPHKELGFREIPKTTDILDERNYIWAGKSFLQTGIPTAWSNLDAYERKGRKGIGMEGLSIIFNGEKPSLQNISKFDYPVNAVAEIDVGKGEEQILMVQPFLDHSFLSGLIFGLKTPNNIKSFTEVRPEQYRQASISVSLITGLLIFILAYLLYGGIAALISFVIYSTVVVYLLVSRYALIENLLIPIGLSSLIFLVLSKQSWVIEDWQKKVFWVWGGIAAGLALVTKESGITMVIAGVLILTSYKIPPKRILYFLLPSLIVGSAFYLYALYVSPKLFFEVFSNQAQRGFFGPLNFLDSFSRLRFAGFPLEGYWVFGFIAMLLLIKRFEENKELVIAFSSSLLVYLFFAGLNHPWYSLVFLPFNIIGSGVFIKEMLFGQSPLRMAIFFLFPFSSSLYWGYNVFHDSSINVLVYRIFLAIFLILTTFSFLTKKWPGLKFVTGFILLLILWKTYQWNWRGFEYLIANWGKLSEPFLLKL